MEIQGGQLAKVLGIPTNEVYRNMILASLY